MSLWGDPPRKPRPPRSPAVRHKAQAISAAEGVGAVVLAVLGFILVLVLLLAFTLAWHAFFGLFYWFFWNLLAPAFGVTKITYLQAIGVSFVVGVLRSIFRPRPVIEAKS